MAISLGFSSNKSKGSQTQHSTTMPIVPDWAGAVPRAITEDVGGLMSGDPYRFVAPQDAYTSKAADVAYSSLGAFDPQWQSASDIAYRTADGRTPSVTAQSLLTGLDKYMSPYLQSVVDTTLKGYDKNAAKTLAQTDLSIAGAGGFGGSGGYLERGQVRTDLADNRAATEAQLRDQGFRTGADLSGQDAARRQEAEMANANFLANKQALNLNAAQLLGGLSAQRQSDTRAGIDQLLATGQTVRGIDSETRQAPWSVLGESANILSALNLPAYFGEQKDGYATSKGKSSGLSLGFSYGSGGKG